MKPYWQSGDGRLVIYHGRAEAVLPTLPLTGVSLVLGDPPYGVREKTDRATRLSSAPVKSWRHPHRHSWAPIIGDDGQFDPSPWLAFPKTILWGANHYANRLPISPTWLVWDKREGGTSDDNADCEMAWSNLGGPARLYSHLWRGMAMRGAENGKPRLHPTQKPVALMAWCLSLARLQPDDLVLVPYLGSGPELVACLQRGYRAIGIEIEERYCEIAARRLEDPPLLAAMRHEQPSFLEAADA